MKPIVIGKNIYLRDLEITDAEFVYGLRCDPELNSYINPPPPSLDHQKQYIQKYKTLTDEYYFIITNKAGESFGTIRIYDIRPNSFCWGSWIVKQDAPKGIGLEAALLVYEYGFYALHFRQAHFDVRKDNSKVVDFHRRFGSEITGEDGLNFYFRFTEETYRTMRVRYERLLYP